MPNSLKPSIPLRDQKVSSVVSATTQAQADAAEAAEPPLEDRVARVEALIAQHRTEVASLSSYIEMRRHCGDVDESWLQNMEAAMLAETQWLESDERYLAAMKAKLKKQATKPSTKTESTVAISGVISQYTLAFSGLLPHALCMVGILPHAARAINAS